MVIYFVGEIGVDNEENSPTKNETVDNSMDSSKFEGSTLFLYFINFFRQYY